MLARVNIKGAYSLFLVLFADYYRCVGFFFDWLRIFVCFSKHYSACHLLIVVCGPFWEVQLTS